MRRILVFVSLLVGLPAAAQAAGPPALQRALEGRVAGEPVECIATRDIRRKWIIPRTAMMFETKDAVYVSRPQLGSNPLRAIGGSGGEPARVSRAASAPATASACTTSMPVNRWGSLFPYRRASD